MKEFAKKTTDDLIAMLSEKREAIRASRFAHEGSKARNVRAARNERREIARIMTALNARMNEGAKEKTA